MLESIIMPIVLIWYAWCMLTAWMLITGDLSKSRQRALFNSNTWDFLDDSEE